MTIESGRVHESLTRIGHSNHQVASCWHQGPADSSPKHELQNIPLRLMVNVILIPRNKTQSDGLLW